jgi:UDP-N-acetylmuramate: L-alanyl-gamma-D-glutamyl-meso-diaminopimelate ligase
MSPDSTLLCWDGDPGAAALARACPGRVETYGEGPGAFWRADRVRVRPPHTTFRVHRNGSAYGVFTSPLMGRHNLANTLAVIGAVHRLGVPATDAAAAITTFAGVRRRQQVRGVVRGITVMDDFAHHPTAVRETLRAVRPFYPDGKILAVFEPRTNTSMRDVFQNVYPEAFDAADAVWVRRPPLLEKIPRGQRFSSERLAADLVARGKAARCFDDTGGIVAHLTRAARPGDLILVMSNGGFDNIHQRLLAALQSGGGHAPDLEDRPARP